MQTSQGNMLQSLRGVRDFLDAHADKLGTIVTSGSRQKLQLAIVELEEDASIQDGSTRASRGATAASRSRRTILVRDHMTPIARIARADLPHTATFDALKMPKGTPTAEKLAAAAYGMGSTAAPYAPTFVAAGLAEDFVAQLEGAADAMIAAIQLRIQSRSTRKVATTGLASRLSAGRRIVHVLDSFVTTALTDDPALLSGWNLVKRVRRVASTPASPAPVAAPTPAPTPAIARAVAA
jgi:hypothetical protein